MFRVAKYIPLFVISPVPWFPLQSLISFFKPGYRKSLPYSEVIDGIVIIRPRFLSLPLFGRRFDGFMMALFSLPVLYRYKKLKKINIIDSHFAYPDGYAASRLSKWLKLPYTVTMRGTEVRHMEDLVLAYRVQRALQSACRVFCVASSLRDLALRAGVSEDKAIVVGNGVDIKRFRRIEKNTARSMLGLAEDAKILVSVGGLTERKGFHRVLEVMPELSQSYGKLIYLIVGGASAEGNWETKLRAMVREHGLQRSVIFMGTVLPDKLKYVLSAADVFVLATRNEGWANVFLEAMACGLPVVTTRVGGNADVVVNEKLGLLVEFGRREALSDALHKSLSTRWDSEYIINYASSNSWDGRVSLLVREFKKIADANC